MGFEPMKGMSFTHFPSVRFQPLSHLSTNNFKYQINIFTNKIEIILTITINLLVTLAHKYQML